MPVAAAALRPYRLPAPATEPPYDDPSPPRAAGPSTHGALALSLATRTAPGVPVRPTLRVVPDPPEEPPALAAGLPAVKAWAETVAMAMAQILTGERTAAQFRHWALPEVVDALSRRAALAARSQRRRAVLRAVHVCLPTEGVAEICTVVHGLARPRALAFRLETRRARWVCTALDLG